MKKDRWKRYVAGIFAGFMMLTICLIPAYARELTRTVRVGFFPMKGFHEFDSAGRPTGYDVAYLSELAKYTGWKYEYVLTRDLDEALVLLQQNKIDLLGSAQFSAANAKLYDYCAHANGMTYGAIIALAGNNALEYEDFSRLSDKTIGRVGTYMRGDDFNSYAVNNGFQPNMRIFANTKQMREALRAGEIDAMVADILELEDDEKIIGRFAPAQFYYMVSKDDKTLLQELDAGIAQIKLDSPSLEHELVARYFPALEQVPLSAGEKEYARSVPVLQVGCVSERAPLAYVDDQTGQTQGIVRDAMESIAQQSGLRMEFVSIPTNVSPEEYLKSGNVDMLAGIMYSEEKQNTGAMRFSIPFLAGRVVMVGRQGTTPRVQDSLTAAMSSEFGVFVDYIRNNYPNYDIKPYKDANACMNAVANGEADVMMQNSYVVERLLQNPQYDKLMILPIGGMQEDLCIGASANAPQELIDLLNKSIRNLRGDMVDGSLARHMTATSYRATLWELMRRHNWVLLAIVFVLICLAGVSWYAIAQRKKDLLNLQTREQMFKNINENTSSGKIELLLDIGFSVAYANARFLELIGYTQQDFAQQLATGGIVVYVHPDDLEKLNTTIQDASIDGESAELEIRILQKQKGYVPIRFLGTLYREKEGALFCYCAALDIRHRRMIIDELKTEKERYRVIIEQSNDIVLDMDEKNWRITSSSKFIEKFGWEVSELFTEAREIDERRIFQLDIPEFKEMLGQLRVGIRNVDCRVRILKADGTYIWCEIYFTLLSKLGMPIEVVGKLVDVDQQVREHERLEDLSQRDQLTGLYNKDAFRVVVEQAMKKQTSEQIFNTVMFIDLDGFKVVNDQLGHLMGDKALKDIGEVMRATFRDEDLLGRFGGDEFCVFLQRVPENIIRQKAQSLCEKLHLTYGAEDSPTKVEITASVGVYHGVESDYERAMRFADRALYQAKRAGKNQYIFSGGQ